MRIPTPLFILAAAQLAMAMVPFQQEQATVSGRVVDSKTGAAINYATVRLVADTTFSTTTDKQGRFTLKVPSGTHLVQVRRLGYASSDSNRVVVSGTGPNIVFWSLKVSTLLISCPFPTGLSDPTSGSRAPYSTAIIRFDWPK